MNIGIDIDDTITNTYETLIPMVAISYGMNIDKLMEKVPSYNDLKGSLPGYNNFAFNNFHRMAKLAPLKEDVVEVITKLKEEGHKIYFISARNYAEYEDPYKLSYDYLIGNGVPFDKLIVNSSNKAKECVLEHIDLFIDDSTKNCKAVKDKGISTLQMNTVFNKDSKGLRKVNSWKEIYNIVQEMYAL